MRRRSVWAPSKTHLSEGKPGKSLARSLCGLASPYARVEEALDPVPTCLKCKTKAKKIQSNRLD
jgi:hypothetical protein